MRLILFFILSCGCTSFWCSSAISAEKTKLNASHEKKRNIANSLEESGKDLVEINCANNEFAVALDIDSRYQRMSIPDQPWHIVKR